MGRTQQTQRGREGEVTGGRGIRTGEQGSRGTGAQGRVQAWLAHRHGVEDMQGMEGG